MIISLTSSIVLSLLLFNYVTLPNILCFNYSYQPGSFPRWDVRAESRSSFLPNRTQYDVLGQPSQASRSQFVRPGYSELYHSQTPVVEEVQRPGGFQDLSSKQLHQFWHHNH